MAAPEFIIAINPDPTKQSICIEKKKYDIIREAILCNLHAEGPMTFSRLGEILDNQLQSDFDGSVKWYFTTVKLDMEARGELRRVPKFKRQIIDLITWEGKHNVCNDW